MIAARSQSEPAPRGPQLVPKSEPEIQWADYVRVEPGPYLAYCKTAHIYADPQFKRWVCLVRWDLVNDSGLCTLARGIPQWYALGPTEPDKKGNPTKQPRASRRSHYWLDYVCAAGRPPSRADRLSPSVFVRRMARVVVRDSAGLAPYSVIGEIQGWETGGAESSSHVVTQSGCPIDKRVPGKDLRHG